MKPIMIAMVLFAGGIWAADAVADRAAIEKTVAALNTWPAPANLFTADFDGRAELFRLSQNPQVVAGEGKPTIEISKEPWGRGDE